MSVRDLRDLHAVSLQAEHAFDLAGSQRRDNVENKAFATAHSALQALFTLLLLKRRPRNQQPNLQVNAPVLLPFLRCQRDELSLHPT